MSSHFTSSHYEASHYDSSHYGREVVPVEIPPDLVHPPGTSVYRRNKIMEEDEAIMAVIIAFLEMKDR